MSPDFYGFMAKIKIILLLTNISVLAMELKIEPLTDEVSRKMQDQCRGMMSAGEVVVTPPGVVLTKNLKNSLQRIRDFEVRDTDVWLLSFPKCGNTWTQEMVWLLKNNIDFERAKKEYLHTRFLFLEYKALWPEGNTRPDNIATLETSPRSTPRFIKAHMPLELLPKQIWTKNPKIIYVSRNPKDVAISYFHHFKLWNGFTGTQDLFLQAFLEDKVMFSPFWNHVLSYWKIRNDKKIHFIFYEDMKKDLSSVMKEVADFLDVTYTPEQEAALLDHLSFASMQKNKMVNFEDDLKQLHSHKTDYWIREGKVGSWKTALSPEFKRRFEEWTERSLTGSDYPRKLLGNESL